MHWILGPAALHHLHLGFHVLVPLASKGLQGIHRRGFRDGLHDGRLDSREVTDECGNVRRVIEVRAVTGVVTAAEGDVSWDRAQDQDSASPAIGYQQFQQLNLVFDKEIWSYHQGAVDMEAIVLWHTF